MSQAVINDNYFEAIARVIPTLAAPFNLNDSGDLPRVVLFTNDIALTRTLVPGDLTAPTYTGYASIPCTDNPLVSLDPATRDWLIQVFIDTNFKPTDEVNLPQTVVGWAVIDDAANTCLWIKKFDVPFIFVSSDVVLQFLKLIRLTFNAFA